MTDLIEKIIAVFNTPTPVTIKVATTKAPTRAPLSAQKTIYTSKTQFDKAVHSALQQQKTYFKQTGKNYYKNPAFVTQQLTQGTYSGLWRVYSSLNMRDPLKEDYFDTI